VSFYDFAYIHALEPDGRFPGTIRMKMDVYIFAAKGFNECLKYGRVVKAARERIVQDRF